MHKKIFIISFLLFLLLTPSLLFAEYVVDDVIGVYKFYNTLNKCELYNSTTSQWVVLWDIAAGDSAKYVDFGAGSVSDQMGTFIQNKSLPVGTYTQMRVTILMLTTIRGWVKVDGTFYFSSASATNLTGSQATQPTEAQCSEIVLTDPGSEFPVSTVDTIAISGSGLTVTEGGTVGLNFIFSMNTLFTATNDYGGDFMIMPNVVEPTVNPV